MSSSNKLPVEGNSCTSNGKKDVDVASTAHSIVRDVPSVADATVGRGLKQHLADASGERGADRFQVLRRQLCHLPNTLLTGL